MKDIDNICKIALVQENEVKMDGKTGNDSMMLLFAVWTGS